MNRMICSTAIAALLLATVPAHSQSTGGQGSNQATPMQQAPAGGPAGVRAAPLGEREFVAAAAFANRFEIRSAELAVARAGDAKLKEFARTMLAGHKAALEKLEAAAAEAGVPMPTEPALDQTYTTKIAALERRTNPAEFDQAYRTDQAQAHQQMLTMLETYQRTGAKEPLRTWAANTAAVVRKHLEMLDTMK